MIAADRSALRAWSRLSLRERIGVALAFVLVAAAIGWALVWQPLRADLDRLGDSLPILRANLDTARQREAEVQQLRRQPVVARTADLRAAVERMLVQRGLRASTSAVDVQDTQVRFTLASVDLAALAALLDALAHDEALFPVELTLTARVEPGALRAEAVLAREPAQ